ncbi:UDP-4-amino-4-deoxy-L-arabinose--oxoglutarate aminotransferase [hydrothermal vent metagenome]|uniref:UDP-4-amino-4-deoxy-L-arabinose--oxoglutarate aminotransferase n=1 Tax=hydrothermal vent metagenome TaxID=652676 RepID=A0A1W1D322_9ZZZZ
MQYHFNQFISTLEAHSNVSDVLDGDNLTQVKKFEKEFSSYIGVKYALATSHGTSALHLAMLALEIKRGDKIICSVNAHPNVPEVVRHFDAEPIFIDIDEQTYNIDLNLLEKYLKENSSKKLKAVIVTHIGGQTVDLKRLYELGQRYDVRIVEDAGDSFGCTFKGQKIGSFTDGIVCFDFSPHMKKNICNGGMLVTNDADIIHRARLLSEHGMTHHEGSLEYIYDVVDIGNDYSMGELDAAYLRAQLLKQDENLQKYKKIAKLYDKYLEGVEHIELSNPISDEHPYLLYIIKVDKNRDSFAMELKKVGVDTALHYIPLHLLQYYKTKYNLRINDFPVALKMYQQMLSLPIYPSLEEKDVKLICDKIKKVALTRV